MNHFNFYGPVSMKKTMQVPVELATLISQLSHGLDHYKNMCDVWGLKMKRRHTYLRYYKQLCIPCTKPKHNFTKTMSIFIWGLNGVRHRNHDLPSMICSIDSLSHGTGNALLWHHYDVPHRSKNRPAIVYATGPRFIIENNKCLAAINYNKLLNLK